jgi:hypothetical protein
MPAPGRLISSIKYSPLAKALRLQEFIGMHELSQKYLIDCFAATFGPTA